MDGWKIIDRDGLPEVEGEYMVITISYEYKDGEKTGRGIAMVDFTTFSKDDGFVLKYDGFAYAWKFVCVELPEIPEWCVWGSDVYPDDDEC